MRRLPAFAAAALLGLVTGQPACAEDQKDEVDTENLFGFTEGSETGKKGEQEILSDTIVRFSKRRDGPGGSGYSVVNTRIAYQYDPTDQSSIELSLFGDARRVRNIADLADKSFGTFDGVSLELKYQFVKPKDDQRFGFAIELRPSYFRVLPIEGQGSDIVEMETVAEFDYQIVPDRLWYGGNVSFDPSVGRLRGSGEVDRSSTFLWSNALAGRVGKDTFLGSEVRYLRAYDGAFLNRFEGHAVTLGPTLYHKFSEKAYVTLAYAAQVAGHDRDPTYAARAFDLAHFERHAVRVKLGYEF